MPNNVKITTLISPLDLIAPHSCRGCGHIGAPLCDCCKKYILDNRINICPACHTFAINGKCPKCRSLPPTFVLSHHDALVNMLVRELKYSSVRALIKPLASLIDAVLPITSAPTVVVPLPTTSVHIRARGLDHTAKLAKHLTKSHPGWQYQKLLLRAKNTVQVGSDRQTRLRQAEAAYQLNHKQKVDPAVTYLLLDDVWTTGASMRAAIKKLRQAGAKHIAIALLAVS